MSRRLAFLTCVAAVLGATGLLGMHAIDAHPFAGAHHGPATDALNPGHHSELTAAVGSPDEAHTDVHGTHGDHGAMAHGNISTLLASSPVPSPDPVPTPAPAPVPAPDHQGHANHIAMCAAMILTAVAIARSTAVGRTFIAAAPDQIVRALLGPEPPVPRHLLAI